MTSMTQHAPGTFCWPELYTTGQGRAKEFYGGLFGWGMRDVPMGPELVYTIFTLGGRDAAACYGVRPEMEKHGVAPHWLVYVAVSSADAAAARVKAAGGTVRKEPFDIPGIGRMAALQDPTGVPFCVWQGIGHPGVGVLEEPGALRWTELMTPDVDKAAAFYGEVFGWRHEVWPSPEQPFYHLFMNGETPAGGMTAITAEMGAMRPRWSSYFEVRSCDAAVGKALALGGAVAVAAVEVPDVGRFAFIADPSGAHFGILQPALPS